MTDVPPAVANKVVAPRQIEQVVKELTKYPVLQVDAAVNVNEVAEQDAAGDKHN